MLESSHLLLQQQGFQRQLLHRLRQLHLLTLRAFTGIYPLVHTMAEGLKFCYQLMYLLDSTPYYSPVLHLLGQQIIRVSGQEMVSLNTARAIEEL